MIAKQNAELTFKGNIGAARHGWLRLTPAYSYRLVADGLNDVNPESVILDPFSGTGTTGLVAAERGMRAVLLDLNPFLVWFAKAKTRNYESVELVDADDLAVWAAKEVPHLLDSNSDMWIPSIHNIERWWDDRTLSILAALHHALAERSSETPAYDLLWIAFSRVMIRSSSAAFNHQSMSFKDPRVAQPQLLEDNDSRSQELASQFLVEAKTLLSTAAKGIPGEVHVAEDDARQMKSVADGSIDVLYTSPPYANRMSYIRELRPYMYWLGYLAQARDAGEIDWKAIGGTWGIATSRVGEWSPSTAVSLGADFIATVEAIRQSEGRNASLLANYVHKYFADISEHLRATYRVMRPGGHVTYVVGNSTFYGELVPTEKWYADLLLATGFNGIRVETVRKRNSKKELFEFAVHAVR